MGADKLDSKIFVQTIILKMCTILDSISLDTQEPKLNCLKGSNQYDKTKNSLY